MAKITDSHIKENLKKYLQEGEILQHWAFGVKQPSILLMIPLFALAVLPGILVTQMLTKSYIVGLTDKRLIVVEVKGITNAQLKALTEYSHAETKGSYTAGKIFTYITIDNAEKPFTAKFHRMFSKDNRAHAVAIGETISQA